MREADRAVVLLESIAFNFAHRGRKHVRVHAHFLHVGADENAILLLADLVHQYQDGLKPVQRLLAVGKNIIHRRRLRQPRQKGRLPRRQLLGGGVEIGFCGSLDAVGSVAVEVFVQVQLKDLLLAVAAGNFSRENDFARLALHCALVAFIRQQQRARQLLRNGGRAAGIFAGGVVQHHGARDGHQVKTRMVVILLILGCQGRRDDIRRHAFQRDVGTPSRVRVEDLVDRVTVAVKNACGFKLRSARLQVFNAGQGSGDGIILVNQEGAGNHQQNNAGEQERNQSLQKTAHRPFSGSRLWRAGRRRLAGWNSARALPGGLCGPLRTGSRLVGIQGRRR